MRSGDFTGAGLPTLYDPTTEVVTGTTVTRQTFISEYGSNKIPAAMLDSVAKNIQAIFPSIDPGITSTVNNYSYISPSTSTLQKWFGRFDADPAAKNHLSGSTGL